MNSNCEEIKPSKLVNLTELFSKIILRMPDYQRGYSWGTKRDTKQLNDLWNDLENIGDEAYHFTGVITLEKITSKSKFRWDKEFEVTENLTVLIADNEHTPYFVVDGQQRLVSLMILISLLSKEKDILEKDRETLDKFISIKNESKTQYLFGYEKDIPSHEYLIGNIFEDDSMEIKEPETLYTQNLFRAKEFFQKKLKHKDIDSFEKRRLYKKLTEKLLFNILEIESEKLDISLVFETLNYRGKALSKLELFKNRLIFLVTKRYPEKSGKIRNSIISTWLDIYEWLGKNKKNELDDDEFLRAFWIMFFQHTDRKDSEFKQFEQDIFESKYKISSIKDNEFLKEYGYNGLDQLLINLSEAVKYWFFIHNPDFNFENPDDKKKFNFSDKIKTTLRKLLRNNKYGGFMKPLILAYFINLSANDDCYTIEEFLLAVERHNYCVYLLAGRQADTNRADFSRTVNMFFRDNKSHYGIIEMLEEKTDVWLTWKNIFNHIHRNRAINKRFYDWNGVKYTLWEWERYLQRNNEPILTDDSKVEIYKIYDAEGEYRNDASFAQVRRGKDSVSLLKLCYSLGNISINKSQRASNTFGKMKSNMSSGSYSDTDIAENYREWTDKTIFQRGLRILEFIEERWNVAYSDIPASDLQLKKRQLLLDGVKVDE